MADQLQQRNIEPRPIPASRTALQQVMPSIRNVAIFIDRSVRGIGNAISTCMLRRGGPP
ncbi:hypothetical protein IU428_26275 [Nocardia abscessus]|uniref:hypothetical protein n=1 Tax=Nocardia abscessus TaxID=120957 RepID=UPI0018934977|nr:hypothetical protein [Nocardia abscessus]MBF6475304.1 hypothetical protein [Nocardia abscessus]